jgi:hypothetical protein
MCHGKCWSGLVIWCLADGTSLIELDALLIIVVPISVANTVQTICTYSIKFWLLRFCWYCVDGCCWKHVASLIVLFFVLFCSNGKQLVNATCEKIWQLKNSNQLTAEQYRFLTPLLNRLSRHELSFEDVSIVTLSLFADGLSTVWRHLCVNLLIFMLMLYLNNKLLDFIRSFSPLILAFS